MPSAHPPTPPEVPASLRAQILATEHWSLLASRSSTQSEMLSRISMFLTLVSAALVSLALVGQATKFTDLFSPISIAVLAFVVVVGAMTQARVANVHMEDVMYVLAMNRLRAAYIELDPGVEPAFMASANDDLRGMQRTYYFLGAARGPSQILGSSVNFIILVNSALVGTLAAAITAASTHAIVLIVPIAIVCGLAYLLFWLMRVGRRFFRLWKTWAPSHPSPSS